MKIKHILIIVIFILTHSSSVFAASLAESQSGMILLQVEENGEAWYVYPDDLKRYYLGRPDDAFFVMRELGLGIAHSELENYLATSFPTKLSGMIMLDVGVNGEAYYVYPKDLKGYYLGRPDDAFFIMRSKGLGISNADLAKIASDQIVQEKTEDSISAMLVDTGQNKCYNESTEINCPAEGSFYGQDAQYQSSSPAYRDNNDGTITDLVTGLQWEKDPGEKMPYYQAIGEVTTAGTGGYADWRIPSIKELYSLIDFSGEDISGDNGTNYDSPFIDTDYFNFSYGDESAGERALDSQWVTSNIYKSLVMNNEECFFGVNFADGRIKCYPTEKDKGYFSILVRGEDYGVNDFVDNANQTITDNSSGLIWQKNDSGYGMNWENALSYCEELELAGRDNWRLPNAKELQYIVDYDRSPDTSDSPAIDPVFQTSSISNEKGEKDYPYFWTSTTHANVKGGTSAVYVSFGRAMGNMNGSWMDVHGAGAQRSDPKLGSADDYPNGHGPQGDAIRINNHVRCVSGAADFDQDAGTTSLIDQSNKIDSIVENDAPAPPKEAQDACATKSSGDYCSFAGAHGMVVGTCENIGSYLACKP